MSCHVIHPSILYTNESKARNCNNPNLMKINNPISEKKSYFMINILIKMIDNDIINIQERLINDHIVK